MFLDIKAVNQWVKMHFLIFDIFKPNLCIFILFVFLKYTDQIKVSSTSGGTHDFRVSLDPSDSRRLLCFCRKGSGVSSHISKMI